MLVSFPFLLIPLAFFNIVTFLLPGTDWSLIVWTQILPSRAVVNITLAEIFIGLSFLLLFLEIYKSARPNRRSIIDNLLSGIIAVIACWQFAYLPEFATITFGLLAFMTVLDTIGGTIIAMATRARTKQEKQQTYLLVEDPSANPSDYADSPHLKVVGGNIIAEPNATLKDKTAITSNENNASSIAAALSNAAQRHAENLKQFTAPFQKIKEGILAAETKSETPSQTQNLSPKPTEKPASENKSEQSAPLQQTKTA